MRVAVPRTVLPSLKVIEPLAMPLPGATAATVAVKVTLCPVKDGLAEEVSVVVVEAALTTWFRAGEVLAVKLLSPA